MHAFGLRQRHEPRRLSRTAAAVAAVVLVSALPIAVGASADTGPTLTINPASASIDTYYQSGFQAEWDSPAASSYILFVNGAKNTSGTVPAGAAPVHVTPADGIAGSLVCGQNVVEVTTIPNPGGSSAQPLNLFATFTASCDVNNPTASVNPPTVTYQKTLQTFTVSSSFETGIVGSALYLDGATEPFITLDNEDLQFQASPTCGQHIVQWIGFYGEDASAQARNYTTAIATITVTCTPAITPSPSTISVADEPATVTVTGSQFYPGLPVTISLNGQDVGSPVTTDTTGDFSTKITVQDLGCDNYDLKASQPGSSPPAYDPPLSADVQFTIRCAPTITVNPPTIAESAEPASVTVAGTGFHPSQAVTISLDGQTVGSPVTTTAAGDFSTGITAQGAPCGTHAVTASQYEGDNSLSASGTLTVTCTPTITPSPPVIAVAAEPAIIGVTGAQFYANTAVTISLNGQTVGSPVTTAIGDFSTTITVQGLNCGTYPMAASQPAQPKLNNPPLSASGTLTVTCLPSIAVNPPVIAEAAEPASVIVAGTEFYANTAVTISLNGQTVGSLVTTAAGDFSTTITAQGLNCGSYTVTASQPGSAPAQPALSADGTLIVDKCPTQVKQGVLTLALNPAVLEPGELTLATGTGFVPFQPVTLTWRAPAGGPALIGTQTVIAGKHGTISTYFLVMPNDLLGPRTLVATQAPGTVTANALVEGGAMQPSSSDRLLYRGS